MRRSAQENVSGKSPFIHAFAARPDARTNVHVVRSSAALPARSFKAGHVLIRQGDRSSVVGVIVEGILKLTTVDQAGDAHVVELLFPSDFFGDLVPASARYSVEAATDVLSHAATGSNSSGSWSETPRSGASSLWTA